MPKFVNACLAVSCLAIPSTAYAGAWPAEKGESYQKLAFNIFDTDERFGDELPEFENFQDFNLTYYAEFGVDEDVTLIVSVPYKDLENTSAGVTTRNSGLGDVDLGVKYNLSDGPFVVSVQALTKLPFLYSENADLPIGNGQVDVEGRFLVGRSLGKLGYFGAEAGYRYRAEEPVDEFRYLIEYGFDLSNEVYVRAKLDGQVALGDANIVDAANPANPALPLAFDLGKLETTAGWKVSDKFTVEFTATQNLYGSNTLRGTNFQFALVAQL
ncbi:MAG: hypothetical protein AAGI28_10105 [Pseudomonadota bacterium]